MAANHDRGANLVALQIQQIEAANPKLSRAELERFHAWYEDFVEERLELTDDVRTKLDESRREIAASNYATRQPKSTSGTSSSL